MRPIGMRSPTAAVYSSNVSPGCIRSQRARHWWVTSSPVLSAFTSTPSAANSDASALVIAMPAARVADVGHVCALGALASAFSELMIRPQPWLRMCGMQSRLRRIAENSFRSRSSCQSSSVMSRNGLACDVPELLTRMSTGPQTSTASACARETSSATRTSAEIAV